MKTFRVSMWETVGGYVDIEAKDQAEAEAEASAMLEESGVEGNLDKVTHREFNVCECTEV